MKNLLIATLLLLPLLSFGLKPKSDYVSTPDKYGMVYHEYNIPSDELFVKSWLLTPENDRRNQAILISIGDYGNMSYSLFTASELYKRGYDVIMYDYRGFGKSSPLALDSNQLFYREFVADEANVYAFYKTKLPATEPINLLSYSMGTIITTLFLNEQGKNGVPGKVIYEGFVVSPDDVCRNIKTLKNRDLTLPMTDDDYKKRMDVLKTKQLLLFVGLKDEVCKVDIKSPFITKQKNWVVVPYNGEHLHGFVTLTKETTGDLYFSRIDDFLKAKQVAKKSR